MIKSKCLMALMACLLVGLGSTAMAASTLTTIGQHPFCKPPLNQETQVRDLAMREKADMEKGFAQAGNAELYQEFQRQIETAQIDQIVVEPGETMEWMFFRRKGKGPVVVTKQVTWAGKEPFEAYRFYITKDGKVYEFVVPKGCGNFALRTVADAQPMAAAPAPAPEPMNTAPLCRLTLSAKEVYCGQSVTADAGGSLDNDGQVSAVIFRFKDPSGKVVWEKTDSEPPFTQKIEGPFDPGKTYTVEAVAVDDKGMRSDGACTQRLAAMGLPGNFVADLGYAHIFDPADFAFGRIGYEIPLVDKLHLMGLVGGFWRVSGEQGESAFVVDALLNYHWVGPFSFGLGLGFWSGDDGQVDVIANVGMKLFDDFNGAQGSLFLEGRSATDEFDQLTDEGRYGIGLRLRF